MWMKSWSSSTSRPQPSAIPDLRRPNIRIGRGLLAGRRRQWRGGALTPLYVKTLLQAAWMIS